MPLKVEGRESPIHHLTYPLRGSALWVLVVFAFLFTIVRAAGLFGLWLGLLLVYLFTGYAFRLLDSIAEGRREPPVMESGLVNVTSEPRRLWLTLMVAIGYWVVTLVDGTAPAWVTNLTALLLISLLPAVIGLLGLRRQGSLALFNPVALVLVAWEMGWYYFSSLAAVLLASALHFLVRGMQLFEPVALFVDLYAFLVVFSATGGALYSRRLEMGTPTVDSPEQQHERRTREENNDRDNFLDEAYRLTRGDRVRDAHALVRRELSGNNSGPDRHQAIFTALAKWESKRLALRVGRDLVSNLVEHRRSRDAVRVARQCVTWDPHFRPLRAAEAIRLANEARQVGDPALARRLLAGFESTYPGDPATAVAATLREELTAAKDGPDSNESGRSFR